MNWMDDFDNRELKEIGFAQEYVRNFNHGTSGHMAYTVIAKLVQKLNEMENYIEHRKHDEDDVE
jgi:hypothetical protein